MSILVLYVLIVLLQTALIYYQHWTPFEREGNLRAVLEGARPAPRYWAVLALDACVGLLVGLLVLSVLPRSGADAALSRLGRALPVWIAASLLAAVLYSHINSTVIRFPNYRLIARRSLVELVLAAVVIAAVLLFVSMAVQPDVPSAWSVWQASLWPLVLPALFVAGLAFVVRALAFWLRVLPLAGTVLHAGLSTGALVWAVAVYGGWIAGSGLAVAGLTGIEGITLALALCAVVALLAAWRLPGGAHHSDAVEPPPLVVSPAQTVPAEFAISASGATLSSARLRVRVNLAPLGFVVENANGEVLWQTAEQAVTRDWLLAKIISIPLLYTGNTCKTKWRALAAPFGRGIKAEADAGALVVTTDSGSLRFELHTPDILRVVVEPRRRSRLYNALSMTFAAPADAHYLGLGQRFNRVDQRGEEAYFLVEEGGVGYEWARQRLPIVYPLFRRLFGPRGSFPNGEQCTGFPVPFALIARERGASVGLFWSTYRPSWFRSPVPGESSPARVTVLDERLEMYLCAGPAPLDVIRQYTSLTGRSETPPAWSFLPWKTNTGAVTESDVREDIHRFRELKIPLAQVGIEHWQDVRGSYEFSKLWYPHIDDLIAEAHSNGYRVHIWHFPYMNAGSATHREGTRRGFFIRNRLGLPYQQRIFHGIATVVDYTNPEASAWHAAIVGRAFHKRGIHGVMTDYAESIPPDSVFYNGGDGLSLRNAYPVMYCRAMQGAARATLGDDYIIYPRAGYAASQRFVNAQWPGDQDTDWDDGDGLPAAVRAMLNASICGFPVHGSDVGGWYDWFAPITTKELYLRWAEVGAYSPLMRAHGGPIGRNREPWKFDAETVEIYRRLSAEHVKLFPYLYTLAREAAQTGTPIIRHPALVWPECPELYAIEDAWLIGEALYVAPVVRPGMTEREVVLPPGDWWSLSENKPVTGPAHRTVAAPLGTTPVFLRRGFVVPRFVREFDTFDSVPAAAVGHLHDAIECWLYPSLHAPAALPLFDGNLLCQGQAPAGAREVRWVLFGAQEEIIS